MAPKRAPKFQTYEDTAGAFRWRLVGANGEKVTASEAYPSRSNARRAIRGVIRIVGQLTKGASTRELLEELAARMEATQNSTKGRELGRLCREAVDNLDAGILNYRPPDG